MLGSFSIMYKVGKEQYQEKLKVLKLVHLDVSDRVVQAGRKGLVMTWEVMTGVSHHMTVCQVRQVLVLYPGYIETTVGVAGGEVVMIDGVQPGDLGQLDQQLVTV